MSVKYLGINVNIHGVDIEDESATLFLKGWIQGAVESCLKGSLVKMFNFRGEKTDIEVEVGEQAGEYSVKVSRSEE